MTKLMVALLAFACLAYAAPTFADGVTVDQEGKKFSRSEITVKRGQTVTFTNKDPVMHNVYSRTPGLEFDLLAQKPGESASTTFGTVGEAEVRCAIHPQMKMKVKVVE